MVLGIASGSRFYFKRGFGHSSVISSSFCSLRSFSNMKEVSSDKGSCVSGTASVTGGDSPVLPPVRVGASLRSPSSDVQSTPEIEKKYVHRVYDAIAPHFSSTRFAKWPKVSAFLNSLAPGSLVLDAGCGNGKYLGLNPNCYFIGCDISAPLIKICADRGHEVLVADAVNLPYRTGYVDAAISIAVLHHLSTESRRRKAVDELIRVVKKGGLVLITVWAREQEDSALLNKWTPLTWKYLEEWVGPGSPRVRSPSSPLTLESIPEAEENGSREQLKEFMDKSADLRSLESRHLHLNSQAADLSLASETEWVGPGSPRVRSPSYPLTLESIPEAEENGSREQLKEFMDKSADLRSLESRHLHLNSQAEDLSLASEAERGCQDQQEFFVPWHLPYHRAEVSGASANAIASGFARKDDKKGAVVYNRYYHVFGEGELEKLVSGIDNAVVVDRFYDKSNWCIILEKTS